MRKFLSGEGFGRGYGSMSTYGRTTVSGGGYGDGSVFAYGDGSGLGNGFHYNNYYGIPETGSGRGFIENNTYPQELIQYWS